MDKEQESYKILTKEQQKDKIRDYLFADFTKDLKKKSK